MPLEVLKAAVANDTVIQGQHWLAPLDIRTGLGMAGLRHQGAYQGRGRAWVGRLQVWTVDGAVIRWEKSRRPPFSYGDTPLLQPCNRATAPSRLNGCVVARLQKSVRQPCVALLAVWASACFKESGALFWFLKILTAKSPGSTGGSVTQAAWAGAYLWGRVGSANQARAGCFGALSWGENRLFGMRCGGVAGGSGGFGVGPLGTVGTTEENCGFALVRHPIFGSYQVGPRQAWPGRPSMHKAWLSRPGPTSKGVVGTLKMAEIRHCPDRPDRPDLFLEDAGTDHIHAGLAGAAW